VTGSARYAGKTAIVTGAAKGMGRSIADAFVAEGARVVLIDQDESALQAAAEELGGQGPVLSISGDVSVRSTVSQALQACQEQFGAADVLVAQAGIGDVRPFLQIDDHAWERMLAVNLNGVFYAVQETARALVDAGRGGAIVVTSSTNAFFPEQHTVHYSTSKGAVVAFVRASALDLAEFGIRINVISPGIIRTPLASPLIDNPAAAADFLGQVPLRRFGEPEEVAHLVLYLASDDAAYITGENIVIDGGMTLGTVLKLPEGALSAFDSPDEDDR
jgi:NAD(P)-dependent dehydrogenase (short-subunit alcohol dehydrogenase family)